MNGRLIATLVAMLCFAVTLPAVAHAQEMSPVTVTDVKTPKLFLFKSADATKPEAIDKTGVVSKITGAKCCTSRMMVEITSEDTSLNGWVLKQHLAIDGAGQKLTAGCNQQVAATQVGSTRGLGDGCE